MELGLDHGKRGMSRLTDEIRSTCQSGDTIVNLEGYEKGFTMGWSSYCTAFHGFDMGVKGDLYKSFCPPEKESLFREKFLIGKQVYEKKDQVKEIEEKVQDLSSNIDKDSSAASVDELKRMKDYLRSLKNEIQKLEQLGTSLVHTN